MKSEYQTHAESIVRLNKDNAIKMIDRLIDIKSPDEYFYNVNTGTSVLEKQHYKSYYKAVKNEIEKML